MLHPFLVWTPTWKGPCKVCPCSLCCRKIPLLHATAFLACQDPCMHSTTSFSLSCHAANRPDQLLSLQFLNAASCYAHAHPACCTASHAPASMSMSPARRNCLSSQSNSRPQRANKKRPSRPAPSLSTQLMAAAASPYMIGSERIKSGEWGGGCQLHCHW